MDIPEEDDHTSQSGHGYHQFVAAKWWVILQHNEIGGRVFWGNGSMANELSIAGPTVKNLGTLLWYFPPFKLKLNDVGLQCLKIICQCLAIGARFPPQSSCLCSSLIRRDLSDKSTAIRKLSSPSSMHTQRRSALVEIVDSI
ncbi:hypothetical protein OIU77_012035 [Salix suchowensis]|uniref:Uncharacterized protein n=1 Tax=Salix suchowensis TaxID=1278906 RepID=A0ABQ9A2F3_9ROSI|nr:hypothetical protein OIU77_012035 [Salix suchowensis]